MYREGGFGAGMFGWVNKYMHINLRVETRGLLKYRSSGASQNLYA